MGQHGTHRTQFVVDYDRGVMVCEVCGRDGATIPPEWYEHNTDVEGEDAAPADPA